MSCVTSTTFVRCVPPVNMKHKSGGGRDATAVAVESRVAMPGPSEKGAPHAVRSSTAMTTGTVWPAASPSATVTMRSCGRNKPVDVGVSSTLQGVIWEVSAQKHEWKPTTAEGHEQRHEISVDSRQPHRDDKFDVSRRLNDVRCEA
eukprot:CAMPEP_0117554500 /NCGR_PEP_ID=MMETSP0784-20121206/50787_1 /TAXON_ID=39447 /ORGANISM="" /LENGTH=145 /DNA_ID=CAMNT_0005351669 /DNA_START=201 /DNA_END=637 /DNA_ORIENTATION=+